MSEEEHDAAADFIDQLFIFLRTKIDLLKKYDVEMEDFKFLENIIKDDDALIGLTRVWNISFTEPLEIGLSDEDQRRAYLLGAVLGFSEGLKQSLSDIENTGP